MVCPDKILQIIPAPAGMKAWYKDQDSGHVFSCPVVCLALMQSAESGNRHIQPMDMTLRDGIIEEANAYGEALYFSIGDDFPEDVE